MTVATTLTVATTVAMTVAMTLTVATTVAMTVAMTLTIAMTLAKHDTRFRWVETNDRDLTILVNHDS